MTTLTLDRYIAVDENDRPHIAERRITVAQIAIAHLRHGESIEAIAENYDLSPASVHAAMAYYYDHRDKIEQSIMDEDAEVAEFVRNNPDLVLKWPR